MPCAPDLLLTVKREMITVFTHDDGGQQTGCRKAAVLQGMQRSNDCSLVRVVAPDILAADQTAA